MIIPREPRIYVAKTAVDLRWGIDRLAGLVAEHFGTSPRDRVSYHKTGPA